MKRICQICQEPFEGKPEKRYCGVRCRKKAERQRERAKDPTNVIHQEPELIDNREFAEVDNPQIGGMLKLIESRGLAGKTEMAIIVTNPSEQVKDMFDLVQDAGNERNWIYL